MNLFGIFLFMRTARMLQVNTRKEASSPGSVGGLWPWAEFRGCLPRSFVVLQAFHDSDVRLCAACAGPYFRGKAYVPFSTASLQPRISGTHIILWPCHASKNPIAKPSKRSTIHPSSLVKTRKERRCGILRSRTCRHAATSLDQAGADTLTADRWGKPSGNGEAWACAVAGQLSSRWGKPSGNGERGRAR